MSMESQEKARETHSWQVSLVFFLLGFLSCGGMALQHMALAVLGIWIPFFLLRQHTVQYFWKKMFPIGGIFLGLYGLFPLGNFLVAPMGPSFRIPWANIPFSWELACHSPFSKGLLYSGLSLIAMFLIQTSQTFSWKPMNFPVEKLEQAWSLGLLTASCILLVYGLAQMFTGFDYRQPDWILPPSEQLPNGLYRVLGFFGHPLSLTNFSLAIVGFSVIRSEKKSNKTWINWILIGFIHTLLVVMSGGRAALFILLPMLLLFIWKKNHGKFYFSIFFLILCFFWWKTGQWERLQTLWGSNDHERDRFIFWKVHGIMSWDRPLWGQGSGWLEGGYREAYYKALGYESLRDKFCAHNLFLEILADLGWGGGLILSLWVVLLRQKTYALAKNSETLNFWKAINFALFVNILAGMTQNTLFDSHVLHCHLAMFWVWLWSLSLIPIPIQETKSWMLKSLSASKNLSPCGSDES